MFFDFSSAFNTLQPVLLGDKLRQMQVDESIISWTMDYLTGPPQFVRMQGCVSDVAMCSTGAPQGTVLAPFLFNIYTSDFRYNSGTCHLQKFSDDTAIVGCIRNGQEAEYSKLVSNFFSWCKLNQLQLNISKAKEMVVDFRRNRSPQAPVIINREEVEVVGTYKYLGVHLDNKLDWSSNTSAVFKRGQSRLYFLRKLRSFGVCTKLLWTFYQSVVASAIFYSVVCWGNSINKTAINKLNKLVKKAGSVIGLKLDTLEVVAEKRTLNKLLAVMDNASHPLHCAVGKQRSTFSGRLRQLRCAKECRFRSFLPTAIRLYNESPYSRNTTDLLLSELYQHSTLSFPPNWLLTLGLTPGLCNWALNFLTDRPQSVRIGSRTSSTRTVSTGTPQGCVLSPLLYTLFTYDCVASQSNTSIIKFADDTTVIGLITGGDETAYRREVAELVDWCDYNNLSLNTDKTKEMIVDPRRRWQDLHTPLLHGSCIWWDRKWRG
ncbi:hypothetical protein NFI96_007064 [Prochilodus magdalenae]|nr:hypothetical protein NFI96_007064 [Prochilodus magdalenae]